MGLFGYDEPDHSGDARTELTQSKKAKIKSLFGKCEYCGYQIEEFGLEVHHIDHVATANGSQNMNRPGNLIVLCLEHHREVHAKGIPKIKLRAAIKKRSATKTKQFKEIMRSKPANIRDPPYSGIKPGGIRPGHFPGSDIPSFLGGPSRRRR
jgi:hypothetical protein